MNAPKQKPLSKAALETLKTAAGRIPPYVLPLKHGIQGIAAKSMLQSLQTLGYVDRNEAPKITELGMKVVMNAKFGKLIE